MAVTGLLGQLIGDRYLIAEELGAGAMGVVYRATDTRLRKDVAVKLLADVHFRNPEVRSRFVTEALIQGGIDHPNIVRATDVIDHELLLAMVIDYVPGGLTLEDHVVEMGGKLPWIRVKVVMEPVFEAVGYAHTQGIVHRDLKPANVLLDRGKGKEIPKVADFGIAKVLGTTSGKTRDGAVMGTPAFMPPEQLKGNLELDHHADLYALGAIVYSLLTGALPYDGTEYEITHKVLSHERPQAPTLVDPSLPAGIDAWVEKAMAFEPQARFHNAAEMWTALLVVDQPGAATTPNAPTLPLAGPPAAATPPTAEPVKTAAAPAKETVFESASPPPALTTNDEPPPQLVGQGRGAWFAIAAVLVILAAGGLVWATQGDDKRERRKKRRADRAAERAQVEAEEASSLSPGSPVVAAEPRSMVAPLPVAVAPRSEAPAAVPAAHAGAPVRPVNVAPVPARPTCVPACSGKSCGSDGCGGTCGSGSCPSGTTCRSGRCECVPSCGGRSCGPDGCGGACGGCAAGARCEAGSCVAPTPPPANVTLPDVTRKHDLERLIGTLTSGGGAGNLWSVTEAQAVSRLRSAGARQLMRLDLISGGARIEVPLTGSKSASKPHAAVEIYDGRVAFVRLMHGKLKKRAERDAESTAFASAAGSIADSWSDIQTFHLFDQIYRCSGKRPHPRMGMAHCTNSKDRLAFVLYDPVALDATINQRRAAARAYEAFRTARVAVDYRGYGTVISSADAVLSQLPNFQFAKVWKAFALVMNGQIDGGISLANEVLSASVEYETQAYAHFVIGRAHMARGNVGAAEQAMRNAAQADPYDSDHSGHQNSIAAGNGFRGGLWRALWWGVDTPHMNSLDVVRRAGLPDFDTYNRLLNAEGDPAGLRVKAENHASAQQARR